MTIQQVPNAGTFAFPTDHEQVHLRGSTWHKTVRTRGEFCLCSLDDAGKRENLTPGETRWLFCETEVL